jgi:hypothetical protein
MPWCHFISGFWRVSLAEYIPALRVYFPLLQVADSYWLPEVPSSPIGVKTRPYGRGPYSISYLVLLQDVATYWQYLN